MKKNLQTPADVISLISSKVETKDINSLALETIAASFLFADKHTFNNIMENTSLAEATKETLINLKVKQPGSLSVNGQAYFGGGSGVVTSKAEKLGKNIPRDEGDGEGGRVSKRKTFPKAEVVSTKEDAFVNGQ
ncbi:MAG: hypothetical protein ACK5N8_03055 [Alphaproteobacteria bacterium]